jgi:DNA polymerase III subunit gamma/tau
MSYIVFARKWRPMTFEDVVGQDHITETLKKAIEKDRVAHAYIFTGTRGVGKTTTARILARALNCEKGPTPSPCGVCENCKSIINGSSFDVIEIDGASNNSVDDIRGIRENIHYSSMGGKHRIYVIDEVHMLTKSAFNALLKTLEEPPPNVIFIFATTEPQKIPATIQSRCQRFDFRRISTGQIVKQLARICNDEHIAFDMQALTLVGRKAEGSMRDALSLLDQVHSYCQESIGEKEVRTALGLVAVDVYESVMAAIKTKDPAPALKAVEEMLFHGFDLQEFIIGFEEYLRTLLFSSIPKALENQHFDYSLESVHLEKARALGFSEKTLLRMTEIIRKTEQELKWSAFPRFSVELALLKLVYMDSTVSVEQILETLGKKSADASPGASVSMSPQTTKPPMFPKQEFQAKKKIELTAFSDNATADETSPQAADNPSPEKKNQETTMSINDEMKREPIINTILDIFDGDLMR